MTKDAAAEAILDAVSDAMKNMLSLAEPSLRPDLFKDSA